MYLNKLFIQKEIPAQSYLNRIPVIRYLKSEKELDISNNVVFFCGENGSGKSTLLEAIAISYGFNPEGGSKNFTFNTQSTHSELHNYITLSKRKISKDGFFLRAESFYNLATNIDILDREPSFSPPISLSYGGKSLHEQSHGESFMALVQNRFGGEGVYILDEPESALSPSRQMTLLAEISMLVKKNSQFIIATHSPILLSFPGAAIYELSENGVALVPYRNTQIYTLVKSFVNKPEQFLKYLLDGD